MNLDWPLKNWWVYNLSSCDMKTSWCIKKNHHLYSQLLIFLNFDQSNPVVHLTFYFFYHFHLINLVSLVFDEHTVKYLENYVIDQIFINVSKNYLGKVALSIVQCNYYHDLDLDYAPWKCWRKVTVAITWYLLGHSILT